MTKMLMASLFVASVGCVDSAEPPKTDQIDQDGIIIGPKPTAWDCTGTCSKYPQRGPTPTLDTVEVDGICAWGSLDAQQVAAITGPCSLLNTTDSSGTTTYWNPYYNGGLADPAYLAYTCVKSANWVCN